MATMVATAATMAVATTTATAAAEATGAIAVTVGTAATTATAATAGTREGTKYNYDQNVDIHYKSVKSMIKTFRIVVRSSPRLSGTDSVDSL